MKSDSIIQVEYKNGVRTNNSQVIKYYGILYLISDGIPVWESQLFDSPTECRADVDNKLSNGTIRKAINDSPDLGKYNISIITCECFPDGSITSLQEAIY